MLGLLRGLFLILLALFTALVIVKDSATRDGFELVRWWPLAVGGMLLFFLGFVGLDLLTPKRKLSTISAIFIGLIAGVLVTVILGTVLDLFSDIYGVTEPRLMAPFKVMLGLGICYLTVSTVMQTQDDFRLVIPYIEFARKIRGPRPLLLDSSSLIDGRVLDLANLGLFQAPLVAPRCVIEELQRLSDSSDRLKRARGRRGLDILERLQHSPHADVSIEESEPAAPATSSVDQRIIELARVLPAQILTTDLGLARVAAIQGVLTLNLNELSNALKQSAVPGDSLTVTLIRRGEQPGQAVGFLPDGAMIVADDAADLIGSQATLIVTSALQTSAGRMIFARPEDRPAPSRTSVRHDNPHDAPHDDPHTTNDAPATNHHAETDRRPEADPPLAPPVSEAPSAPIEPRPTRAADLPLMAPRDRAPVHRPDSTGRSSQRNPRRA